MFTAALDQQLLSRLAIHYTITNPDWALENAHRYCVLVQQGIPTTKAQEMAASESLTNHPIGNEVGIEGNDPWTGTASGAVDAAWEALTTEAMVVSELPMTSAQCEFYRLLRACVKVNYKLNLNTILNRSLRCRPASWIAPDRCDSKTFEEFDICIPDGFAEERE